MNDTRPAADFRVRAPYNFVPLSEHVYFPEWSDQVTHDAPFADGVCGTLDLEIVAETPIFVRGSGAAPAQFFALPDGTFAIPGSEIRGMIRNTMEIATFAKFAPVNDHRYSVRDLQNEELYRRHMADIRGGVLTPLVTAGWLSRNEGRDSEGEYPARITPCAFAKIEYSHLQSLARDRRVNRFEPGKRQSAVEKYRAWGETTGRSVEVGVEVQRAASLAQGWLGDYGVVSSLTGPTKGELVFTGQPSPWRTGERRKKHHDFVFYAQHGARELLVSRSTFNDFSFIHSDRGQQNRASAAPNEEWKYWREKYLRGEKVPIFFLVERAKEGPIAIRAMGLAMMFRLGYRRRIGDAILGAQKDALRPRADFPETLFGYGSRKDEAGEPDPGLAGRVSIGCARSDANPTPCGEVRAVLGAPKASYYPSYIEQEPLRSSAADSGTVGRFKTLMDDDARPRGWKRFRPQDAEMTPRLPERAKERVISRFQPLPSGTTFRGKIRLHNLRRVELGALLWTLDFGGAENAFHTLGMARSLGFGRVRLAVDATENQFVAMDGQTVDLAGCREEFVQLMEGWCSSRGIAKGWRSSMEIFQLVACATPLPHGSEDGRHMRLDHPRFNNEFALAKMKGVSLRPAASWTDWDRLTASAVREPPQAEDPLAGDRLRLETAYRQGQHVAVLREWMDEGGSKAEARRTIAQKVIGQPSKKMHTNQPDVVAWLRSRTQPPA